MSDLIDGLETIARRRGSIIGQGDVEIIQQAIAALKPRAHSKSEYKRLTAQGADVLPPDVERTCVSVPRADIEKWMKALDHHATDGYYNNWGVIYTIRDMRQLLYNNSPEPSGGV